PEASGVKSSLEHAVAAAAAARDKEKKPRTAKNGRFDVFMGCPSGMGQRQLSKKSRDFDFVLGLTGLAGGTETAQLDPHRADGASQ
ncbi:MAG TPA: hypothetical protein PKA88_19130, partial [Polyangiaceae bacterium]|nr:hypothetical protein [Polyangiaceae bacterium]